MLKREFEYERPDAISIQNPNEAVTAAQLQAISGLKDDPIEFSSDIFDLLSPITDDTPSIGNNLSQIFNTTDVTSPPTYTSYPVMQSTYNNPYFNSVFNNNTNLSAGGSPEIFIPAEAMNPTTTSGCAQLAKVEAGTNDIDYWVLAFDTTTAESCFFTIRMPDDWDSSTVTFRFIWTNASGLSTETVDWGIKGLALSNDEAIDQAYGTEVVTTDTWLAQNDIHITPESDPVTPAGALTESMWCQFKITRKTGTDNMTGDARLIGIRLKYGRA